MRIDQVSKLLQEKGLKIVIEDSIIYHDERTMPNIPLENHYALIREGGKWNFCLVVNERRNIPEITVEKSFSMEEKAMNYFFLNRLKRYYMDHYVLPQRKKLSGKTWDENALVLAMKDLNIPLSYLSTDITSNGRLKGSYTILIAAANMHRMIIRVY